MKCLGMKFSGAIGASIGACVLWNFGALEHRSLRPFELVSLRAFELERFEASDLLRFEA